MVDEVEWEGERKKRLKFGKSMIVTWGVRGRYAPASSWK